MLNHETYTGGMTMAGSAKEHQQKLARSGYRLPDSFYRDQGTPQPSAEQQSGDGGANAVDAKYTSDAGYSGEYLSAEETEPARTVDPKTGQTIPDALEAQTDADEPKKSGKKSGSTPSENKAEK